MIYITNANARINILSITASCREYTLFVGWGGGGIWAVDSQENH